MSHSYCILRPYIVHGQTRRSRHGTNRNRRSGADARNLHRCTSGGRAACPHGNRSPCRVLPTCAGRADGSCRAHWPSLALRACERASVRLRRCAWPPREIQARKHLRGRQSPPRYTRSRAAGRRRCVLKNRRPSLVIASGRGGRPHCARQLPSKSLRPRPGTRDCSARDCVERWQWHKQCRQW